MRIGTVGELKSGTILKALLAIFLLAALPACGKKKKSPPPPCGVGVNQSVCSPQVRGQTAWSTEFKSWTEDEKTKQPVPGSERKITVIYEFMEATPSPQWRRTMIIESQSGNTGMFQQGTVTNITSNQIGFAIEKSSCDDYQGFKFANYNFNLYYLRFAGTLRIDTSPIVEKRARNLTEAIFNPIFEALGAAIRTLLERAFTFGSARKYLEAGHGSYWLSPNLSRQQIEAKNVELGCFSSFGSGYSKSNLKPTW